MTDARKADQNFERGWLSRQLENAAHRAAEMPAWMTRSEKVPTMTDARKALADANRKDAQEFCEGAFGPFVTDVSQYVEIVAELMQHATDRALRSPLPGTREEVARASGGTQDRDAMYHLGVELGALKAVVCDRRYSNEAVGLRVRNCWEVYESGLLALPPAPMPEREGVREKLERFASEVERCEHGTFLIDIAKNIRAFATALAPHDKTEG